MLSNNEHLFNLFIMFVFYFLKKMFSEIKKKLIKTTLHLNLSRKPFEFESLWQCLPISLSIYNVLFGIDSIFVIFAGNHQDINLRNTINAFGKNMKNIFLPVATTTSYFSRKMIRIVLLLSIKIIIDIADIPGQLIINIYRGYLNNFILNRVQPIDGYIGQANQVVVRQLRNKKLRRYQRVYNRRQQEREFHRREHIPLHDKEVWDIMLQLFFLILFVSYTLYMGKC